MGHDRRQPAVPPADGTVRVGCEKRRGGTVTLIYGLGRHELETVGNALKRLCATGGSAKDGIVGLQGDHRDRVLSYFAAQARRTKKMGG